PCSQKWPSVRPGIFGNAGAGEPGPRGSVACAPHTGSMASSAIARLVLAGAAITCVSSSDIGARMTCVMSSDIGARITWVTSSAPSQIEPGTCPLGRVLLRSAMSIQGRCTRRSIRLAAESARMTSLYDDGHDAVGWHAMAHPPVFVPPSFLRQTRRHFAEISGERRPKAHRRPGHGMCKSERGRMEEQPRRRDERPGVVADVHALANQRMPGLREVNAYLVRLPRLQPHLAQRRAAQPPHGRDMRHRPL